MNKLSKHLNILSEYSYHFRQFSSHVHDIFYFGTTLVKILKRLLSDKVNNLTLYMIGSKV